MAKRFGLAIVGGTFDHFHRGHEALLSKAFAVADRVFVGVCDEKMARRKPFSANVEPFSVRMAAVRAFAKKKRASARAKTVKISDVFGPRWAWSGADAIVVTKDTIGGAMAINRARKKAGLGKARVIVCPFVAAQDGSRISSAQIRLGRMDRNGKVFLSKKAFSSTLAMPASLAPVLRRPFGTLLLEPGAARKAAAFLKKQKPVFVATVGDATFRSLSALGATPGLAIVDAFELRAPCKIPKQLPKKRLVVSNPAGKITPSLVFAIRNAVASSLSGGVPVAIIVRGEEDLAILPVILALPPGSVALYGQPSRGIVAVKVSEQSKAETLRLLSRFKKRGF